MKNKLILIDAYAFIYRGYYAFINNPRINSKGVDTSAVFGFINTIFDILNRFNPDFLGIVFDTKEKTFRHKVYREYKANRKKMPEPIINNLKYIDEFLKCLNTQKIYLNGYEADDVIGTIAKKAEKEHKQTYIFTPDKDFAQLVSDKINIIRPGSKWKSEEIWGTEEVLNYFEIERVDQVIEYLGMTGDSVDNIPGFPGIGPKTAKKLIKEFDNIDNLITNVDSLKGKLKDKIKNHQEIGKLSKNLVTIDVNAPINISIDELKYQEYNKKKLIELFKELEFKNLIKKIENEQENEQENGQENQLNLFSEKQSVYEIYENIKTVKKDYQIISNEEELKLLTNKIVKAKNISFDTETTSLDIKEAEIIGISFSYKNNQAFYVDLNHEFKKQYLKYINKIFSGNNKNFIAHNIKYDLAILLKNNIKIELNEKRNISDTMIINHIINPENSNNLNDLAINYLNYDKIKIEDIIGYNKKQQKNMKEVEINDVGKYCCEDSDITLQLFNILNQKIEKEKDIKEILNIEYKLINVLIDIEKNGIKIDSVFLNKLSEKYKVKINLIEESIFDLAEQEFNLNSPKQLGEILFEKLKINNNKKTKTGQYSTSEETLINIKDKHPIIQKILEYRTLQKLTNTYIDTLPKLIYKNKIHTNYNQAITLTGRLSSNNPNLQNIPVKNNLGKEIRKAFIPSKKENTILCADYSQIELRVMAEMSKDTNMKNAFLNNVDIHSSTASKIFNLEINKINPNQRRVAKMVNFGIVYGISSFGLARRLKVSKKEASKIIQQYFNEYPDVKLYMERCIKYARENNYVKTFYGRKRFLKDINSHNDTLRSHAERNAINSPIQGTAAEIIKKAMIKINIEMEKNKLNSKMILQVHDELVFDVEKYELNIMSKIIKQEMEDFNEFEVPLCVEIGTGENWFMSH